MGNPEPRTENLGGLASIEPSVCRSPFWHANDSKVAQKQGPTAKWNSLALELFACMFRMRMSVCFGICHMKMKMKMFT